MRASAAISCYRGIGSCDAASNGVGIDLAPAAVCEPLTAAGALILQQMRRWASCGLLSGVPNFPVGLPRERAFVWQHAGHGPNAPLLRQADSAAAGPQPEITHGRAAL
jgi:hypothetical protein